MGKKAWLYLFFILILYHDDLYAAVHADLTYENNHVIHRWEYTDAATRSAATGFVATDINKVSKQLNNNTYWVLIDDIPPTWTQLATQAGPMSGPVSSIDEDIVVFDGIAGTDVKDGNYKIGTVIGHNFDIVDSIANLTTKTVDGQVKITRDEYNNFYSWDEDNQKWRVHTNNMYTTGNIPSASNYTIMNGTEIFDITTETWKIYDSTAAAWRVREYQHVFSVTNTAQSNLTSGNETIVTFNRNEYDSGSGFNTGSYTYTTPVAGVYFFSVSGHATNCTTASQVVIKFTNSSGTSYYPESFNAPIGDGVKNEYVPLNLIHIMNLSAGTTIQVRFTPTSSSNIVDLAEDDLMFSGFLINPVSLQ